MPSLFTKLLLCSSRRCSLQTPLSARKKPPFLTLGPFNKHNEGELSITTVYYLVRTEFFFFYRLRKASCDSMKYTSNSTLEDNLRVEIVAVTTRSLSSRQMRDKMQNCRKYFVLLAGNTFFPKSNRKFVFCGKLSLFPKLDLCTTSGGFSCYFAVFN